MMNSTAQPRCHLLRAVGMLLCCVVISGCRTTEPLPPTVENMLNRPVLDKPLLERKLILAHHMTAWIGWPEAPAFAREFEPVPAADATVTGTRSISPMYLQVQDQPIKELEAAVRDELRAATAMGLDGFQFFYPIHMHDGFLRNYSRVVKTFIKQAELHYPDFRVTLCLCAPTTPASEEEMRAQWAEHIRWILEDTADSPIWLRSPDGRLIMYTWVPEGIVDAFRAPNPPHIHHREGIAATAVAYEKLAQEIGEPIAWIFHMRGRSDDDYANLVYDYFPAAWRWTDGDAAAAAQRLTALARSRHRLFSTSVYPGFHGHLYRGEGIHGNGDGEVGRDPIETLWRPYMKTRQTQLYRDLLQGSITADTDLISVITWNDITENTQLMPEVNSHFVLGVLLNHYANIWRGQPERNDREIAIVAYKKHRLDRLLATDVGLHIMNPDDYGDLEAESRIEIVTILQQPAEVWLNGTKRATVAAGLVSTSLAFEAGAIRVAVRRGDATVLALAPSEWATDTPRRNDPVSVMLSTEHDRYFQRIFGTVATPYQLREYAPPTTPPTDAE